MSFFLGNSLVKKWKNIKDNFNKSLKKKARSGQAADSKRRYIYARQLSFLQTAGATTQTQSSIGGDDEEEVLEQNATQPEETIQKPSYNKPSKKRKSDVESCLIDFMKTPISAAAVPERNPDMSFFESILPSISGFTEDQKLEFRCEILNLIKRMRMSNQQNIRYASNMSYSTPSVSNVSCSTPQSSHNFPSSGFQQYSSPPSHSSNYFSQYQQTSQQLTELLPRPGSFSRGSTSSSTCDNQRYSEEESLDIFRDGV